MIPLLLLFLQLQIEPGCRTEVKQEEMGRCKPVPVSVSHANCQTVEYTVTGKDGKPVTKHNTVCQYPFTRYNPRVTRDCKIDRTGAMTCRGVLMLDKICDGTIIRFGCVDYSRQKEAK